MTVGIFATGPAGAVLGLSETEVPEVPDYLNPRNVKLLVRELVAKAIRWGFRNDVPP